MSSIPTHFKHYSSNGIPMTVEVFRPATKSPNPNYSFHHFYPKDALFLTIEDEETWDKFGTAQRREANKGGITTTHYLKDDAKILYVDNLKDIVEHADPVEKDYIDYYKLMDLYDGIIFTSKFVKDCCDSWDFRDEDKHAELISRGIVIREQLPIEKTLSFLDVGCLVIFKWCLM